MADRTSPVENPAGSVHTAPRLAIQATYQDPVSKALYVHQNLVRVQEPWAEEAHLPPMNRAEKFGDVESWVAYVQRFGPREAAQEGLMDRPFLTWNSQGLRAILDYPGGPGESGRCQWLAIHPFEASLQWRAWAALVNGQPVGQRQAVERLEDLAEDIREPAPADLANLLRGLRATVKAMADTQLQADGGSKVFFTEDKSVKTAGELDVPPFIAIAIPVLKGHLDGEGRPVLYRLAVRLRVSIGDDARLSLRFTIPTAERVLEDVYADRVRLAKELLGDRFTVLRAAG